MRALDLHSGAFRDISMRIPAYFFLGSVCFSLCADTNFLVVPKKKQPKVTAQDCIQEILEGQKIAARHLQYMGQIQNIELQWGQDFTEDVGIFKKAKPEQLQEYMAHKEKSNQARLDYEQALKDERDFLKQFEQNVLMPKKKK
jgi:hypothetical protein